MRQLLCWLLVVVSAQVTTPAKQHDPDRVVVVNLPFFSAQVHTEEPVWAQLHVPFALPFICSGAVYAVEFALESLDPQKSKRFRHPFTEEHLVDQTALILRLPAGESGEYFIKVQIYDTFLGLDDDSKLLGVRETPHRQNSEGDTSACLEKLSRE